MKTLLKLSVILAVLCYLIFAVVKFSHPTNEELCTQVDIIIEMPDSCAIKNFLDEEYVRNILNRANVKPENKPLKEVNLLGIQDILKKDPYLDSAYCYYTPTGILCVEVTSKQPVMEVLPENAYAYYMDIKGDVIPLNRFNLELPVISGNISVKEAKGLIPLASFITRNNRWKDMIEQIHYDNKNIILTLREGDFNVNLGSIDDFEHKLTNLDTFLQKGLPQIGWNKYSTINVAFNNQIVCQK